VKQAQQAGSMNTQYPIDRKIILNKLDTKNDMVQMLKNWE